LKIINEILFGSGYARLGFNKEELMTLSQKHVVGIHSAHHMRMRHGLDSHIITREIEQSKYELEKIIKKKIDCYCWVGGECDTYNPKASQCIKKSGYNFSFGTTSAPIMAQKTETFKIQRTNVETNWPLELLKFQVSGLTDFLFSKRRRIANSFIEQGLS